MACFRIHAHIERTVLQETEPPFGPIELRRRHAEIEKNTEDSAVAKVLCGDTTHVLETRMPDCEPKIVLKPLPRIGDGVGVLVEREQSAFRPQPGKNRCAMTPASVRAIHVAAICCYRQSGQ